MCVCECIFVCEFVCVYACVNSGGGTHKKVGGRNLITSMVAAGGVRVGGKPSTGAENTVGPYI